jgi:uncharacterized protein
MYNRLISLAKNQSLFLFGQRGTGKTTLLKNLYGENALTLSLLDSKLLLTLTNAPWKIREFVEGRKSSQKIVIIDEIQKLPKLLDEVHKMMEESGLQFILTGSSARKLKREGTNLLAGRAYEYRLYPLSYQEIGKEFNLQEVLHWGALPRVVTEQENSNRSEFLYSYVDTYLREEIILEQVVRNIEPFSKFLEVAAQSNGDIVSYTNIAKDSGLSDVTIRNYFDILESTLIGFYLPAYHISVRKRQKQSPKFYFHDLGIVRTLTNQVTTSPIEQTFEYGTLFESFVINEFIKLNEYLRLRYKFSFIRIDNNQEIDLIVEKPGGAIVLVEIKSTRQIRDEHVKAINQISPSFKNASAYCLSQDQERKKIGATLCVPWNEGLGEICGGIPLVLS